MTTLQGCFDMPTSPAMPTYLSPYHPPSVLTVRLILIDRQCTGYSAALG